MTGTEMIDAIAHIDEDLIDGCLARMKARSSETAALHAKEAIREKTKKPLPAFAKAALAFGALAAVLLLSFALISLLHIGGKSPTPIMPVSTHTPTPTEAGNEDGESPFRYSVAVVLDNEESLKFKTYGAEDFPEADAIEVVNVSEALEKSIRELVENGVNNEDVKEYNKCLRIVLKDPCEENASACASRLRERDHVVSAEPYLEPYDVTIEGLRCSIAETILNAAGKITVADRVFLYPRSFHIDVTNEEDGRVYDLSYAYKNGMMTYDGLSELYRIHVEYMIRKFGYTEETYKKEAFVHYAFIGSCEIGFAHEETGEIEVKDVAGSKFIFVHPFTIVVQKIGEEDILDITEAYEADLLTEEDVAEAARLHREFVISTFDFGEKLYEELASEPTEGAEPMTLGNGHTANFTFVDKLIFVDFELPEGFELRTEKGDETKLPLLVFPHNGGYIFGPDGKLVGCFTAYPYDESATDDDLERIYAEFRLGHWHIMLEEMYEPIADHGTVHPALTLAEGVELIDGQTIGENDRFICDALIAYDTASHAKLELAFFRGKLDRKQLTAIAQSIILSAEDRNNPAEAGLCGSDSETSFDFSACSEKILRLTPYIADIQPELPEDAPEDVILYIDNSDGGDVTNLSARWIASDGHYLCIYDMRCCLTVFKDGAFLYRKFAYMGMGAAGAGACLTEGRLYSADSVVDVMTGEVIAQLKMREPCEDSIVAVKNKDGRPVLITERMDGDQICFDRYELGDDNAWALAGEYLRVSEKSGSDENGNAVIECGGESYTIEGMEPFPEGRMMIELLGIDSSGAVVLNVGFGLIVRCEKGYSVAKTMTHPFDPFALWDPDLFFDLLPDGTIYMGVPLMEAFEVYRISFRSAEPTEVFPTKMIDAEG